MRPVLSAVALESEFRLDAGSTPSVTIIIPVLNESAHIDKCLRSILENDYPIDNLQIIVADGGSTDGTREILERYSAQYPYICIVDNPTGNKASALNMGIASSTSDVVMRIDAHATYAVDYIGTLVRGLFRHAADNIGGIRETYEGHSIVDSAIAAALSHPFAAGNAYWRTGSKRVREVDTVFCGCYRRDVFDRIGVFNVSFVRAQDREFNARLKAMGGKIVLDPSAKCTYYPRTDIGSYALWMMKGAFWLFSAPLFAATPMLSWRNFIPPAFVLWTLVTALLSATMSSRVFATTLFAGPLALYSLCLALIAVQSSWTKRRVFVGPVVAFLIALTHFSYGFGAIGGTVHWLTSRTSTR